MKHWEKITFVKIDAKAQAALYDDLKKISGLIPHKKNSHYSVIFDDSKLKNKVLALANKHGIAIHSITDVSRKHAENVLGDYEKHIKKNPIPLREESPDTLEGSLCDEQIMSRLWMAKKLKEVSGPIKSCIVLGSWYGLLPYILARNNKIKTIFAIDNNPECIEISKRFNPEVKHFCRDCNDVYLGTDCIINPSINNISDRHWFKQLDKDKLCLLQTESIAVSDGCPDDLKSLKKMYPLRKVLYEGILECSDTDGTFVRSMVIGRK
jgi:hypothetical protein